MSCRALACAVLALVGLGSAQAAEPVAVVSGPGDQSAPALSATRLAYTDDASGAPQVWIRELDTGAATQLSSGAGAGAPDVEGSQVAWGAEDGLHLVTLGAGGGERVVPAGGAAAAALSPAVVAWEQAGPGGRDVAILPSGAAAPVVIGGPGDEHGPAAAFGWVAWIDEAGEGAIRLRSAAGAVTTVRTGRASKVSLWASSRLAAPLLAAAVPGGAGDQDLVVLDAAGAERARLALPGEQQNPTLSGEWVGFEDLASGVAQVAVWQWSTGRVVHPAPTAARQILDDLAVDGDTLRVAWADGRSGTLDVWLFEAALPLPDVPPGEARCDDPLAPVLSELLLTAGDDGRAAGAVAFDSIGGPALACVDGVDAAAAWVQVGEATVELPFEPGTGPGPGGAGEHDHHHWHHDHGHGHDGGHFDHGRHRGHRHDDDPDDCLPPEPVLRHAEARFTLAAGPSPVAGLLLGWPGATLHVRVLADGWTAPLRAGCLAGVDCPAPAAEAAAPVVGCDAGAGGLLALAVGAAALLRLRRRRA